MSQTVVQQVVVSNSVTQFTEAIAQNGISANYNLQLPGRHAFWLIRGFSIVAVQNLAYELWLFNSATPTLGAVATEKWNGVWAFGALSAGDPGYAVTGDALFHYYVDGNMIPYYDEDVASGGGVANLHLRLINRSATGKNANATGALTITAFVSEGGF